MNQDTVSNLYDFPAREYGIQGRWPSPDPAGIRSVSPSDPQTWNRYVYARNYPLGATDPTGQQFQQCVPCASGGGNSMLGVYIGGWGSVAGLDLTYLGTLSAPVSDISSYVVQDYSGVYELANGDIEVIGFSGFGDNGPNTGYAWENFSFFAPVRYAGTISPGGVKGDGGMPKPKSQPQSAKKTCNPGGANATGTLFGYPATSSFSAQVGVANASTTGDISIGTPGLAATMDFSINAPQDYGLYGIPAPQASVALGKFISVGTYLTASGPQGITASFGYGLGLPINVSAPVANVCSGG